mgnify:CR=1 FL=1
MVPCMKLYHSNDLEVLKGILLSLMRQQPPSPFDEEAILVQSQGMAHWLRLNIADGLGVAAQLAFPLPSSFVWQVFNHLQPELPSRSHFDKPLMAWKLVRLLPELLHHPECAAIRHYLDDDPRGIRLYQLAQNVADLFDQYLVYRPDWLLNWEQGTDQIDGADSSLHPWQPLVWRALVEDARSSGQNLDHRARLLEALPELVRRYPQRLKALPRRLFVFGIAALPATYWQVLQAISPVIEVHFFLLNPCRNFWGDIVDDRRRLRILQRQPNAAAYLDRGNPLLASWGQVGRDFLTLVHDSDSLADVEAWVEPEGQSLLRCLQRDVLDLYDRQSSAAAGCADGRSGGKTLLAITDDSLRLVSAHGPLREVQRLHDQLLHWFSHDPTLKPRDVVVMVPDVDLYAPYIDAVFASASSDTRIPWAIADQSLVTENPVLTCFLGLLGLPDSRLLVTEVQDWLDVAVLRARFGIAEEELDDIRDWLVRARVRWGLDGQQRVSLGLPEFEQNSWRKGLRQLLLGLMVPDRAPDWCGDWPVAAVEGTRAELLGKLLDLVDSLEYWQQRLQELSHASDWLLALPQLLDAFFAGTDESIDAAAQQASVQRIRDLIGRWQDELALAGALPGLPLTATLVRAWFAEQLGQQGGWQRFLAGPVNFCTLMPMRSIPFRVVCLLGMNDSDYPRTVPPASFDLISSGVRRRGDRSRRDDDRYLFLEALCSAQQHLYISYRGRDARENNPLQPSVLVSELQDYILDSFCLSGDEDGATTDSRRHLQQWLCEELPLQAFNPRVFDKSDGRSIGGFQPLWARVAAASDEVLSAGSRFWQEPLLLPLELQPASPPRPILWEDVKAALRNGADFFVRRRLRANLTPWWQEHPTEEPFALDGLDSFRLRHEQLQRLLSSRPDAETRFVQRQQALGQLPVKALGEFAAEQLQQRLQPLADLLRPLLVPKSESAALVLRVDCPGYGEYEVLGELQHQHGDLLVRYRAGNIRAQDWLDAWLDLLLVAAVSPQRITRLEYVGGDKTPEKGYLLPPDQDQARALISLYCAFYLDCWRQPSDCLPEMLWAGMTAGTDKARQAEAIRKKGLSDWGELHKPAVKRCLPELAGLLDDDEGAIDWLERHRWVLDALLAHSSHHDTSSVTGESASGESA